MLSVIGLGSDSHAPEGAPRWELIEWDPDGNPTRRSLAMSIPHLAEGIFGYER